MSIKMSNNSKQNTFNLKKVNGHLSKKNVNNYYYYYLET